jgi:hypothetical protein
VVSTGVRLSPVFGVFGKDGFPTPDTPARIRRIATVRAHTFPSPPHNGWLSTSREVNARVQQALNPVSTHQIAVNVVPECTQPMVAAVQSVGKVPLSDRSLPASRY